MNQLARIIYKTILTDLYALQIIWRKWFTFGLKFIRIRRYESAYLQPSLYVHH